MSRGKTDPKIKVLLHKHNKAQNLKVNTDCMVIKVQLGGRGGRGRRELLRKEQLPASYKVSRNQDRSKSFHAKIHKVDEARLAFPLIPTTLLGLASQEPIWG